MIRQLQITVSFEDRPETDFLEACEYDSIEEAFTIVKETVRCLEYFAVLEEASMEGELLYSKTKPVSSQIQQKKGYGWLLEELDGHNVDPFIME